MPKKQLLLISLLFCLFNLNAQKDNILKLELGTGFLLFTSSDNLGVIFNIEPKLKVSENVFMGLKMGLVINPQKYESFDSLRFKIDDQYDNGGVYFVPTFDYYFNDNKYRPYLGLGVGVYLLSGYVDVISNSPFAEFEVKVNKQLGVLLRGGFEKDRLRFGLEYNLIKKADIRIPNGAFIGTVYNSYFGISIGFIIGSGASNLSTK